MVYWKWFLLNLSIILKIQIHCFRSKKYAKIITSPVNLCQMCNKKDGIESSLSILNEFNKDFLNRLKIGRQNKWSYMKTLFMRAQDMGLDALQAEKETLRYAITKVSQSSREVVLGIMAPCKEDAISVLKVWVPGIGLRKGVLRGVDENNNELDISSLSSKPVFVKYNSSDSGDAYIKAYGGENRGVLFQPVLEDGEFRQYGDFPLSLFN